MFSKIFTFILFVTTASTAWGWGFWAHPRINRLAVFTLPPDMLQFYKAHIEYITEHAVDPDKRRYAIEGEDIKHYIDLDKYGVLPFENLPRTWKSAVALYTEDSLKEHGILPYNVPKEMYQLTVAFREKDLRRILKISADLGHYLGDAHVPLHTTSNYNGQLTGQKGIHGFWESRIPELFGESFNLFAGRAYYVEDIEHEIWNIVLESHAAVDSVLKFEKELSHTFDSDLRYSYESRNAVTIRTYSKEYSQAFMESLGDQIERRMRRSILRIGSFWYTAWKNAGSPDLSDLSKVKFKDKPTFFDKKLKIIDRESLAFQSVHKDHIGYDMCCCENRGAYVANLSLMDYTEYLSRYGSTVPEKGFWEKFKAAISGIVNT